MSTHREDHVSLKDAGHCILEAAHIPVGGGEHLEADKGSDQDWRTPAASFCFCFFFLVAQCLTTSMALAALYQSRVPEHTAGHRLVDLKGERDGSLEAGKPLASFMDEVPPSTECPGLLSRFARDSWEPLGWGKPRV